MLHSSSRTATGAIGARHVPLPVTMAPARRHSRWQHRCGPAHSAHTEQIQADYHEVDDEAPCTSSSCRAVVADVACSSTTPDGRADLGSHARSRRRLLAAAPALAAASWLGATWPASAAAAAQTEAVPNIQALEQVCSSRLLDGPTAAALTRAVYTTVVSQQVLDERSFQVAAFRLRDREYRYYAAAHEGQLPRVPSLEDASGGLSNVLYFNFVYYTLWKVVAQNVVTPEARTAFVSAAGRELLQLLAPELVTKARAIRDRGPSSPATEAEVAALVLGALRLLQERRYICGYALTWGELPGTWPMDWAQRQPQQALQGGGFAAAVAGSLAPSDDTPPLPGQVFQVRLQEPADIAGSVALRAEEDGFWGRPVSSLLTALLQEAGVNQAAAEEYWYQDNWKGPAKWSDRLLLALGDPLQQVDVPWDPTTLVQNWTLA